MAGEPMLRRGSQGAWVSHLQTLLDERGIDTGAIDGIFGPITEGAVREYQEANELKVDGIVGPITWGSLNQAGGDDEVADEDEYVTIRIDIPPIEDEFTLSHDELVAWGFNPNADPDTRLADGDDDGDEYASSEDGYASGYEDQGSGSDDEYVG